jgi:hypothetical protein
MKEVYWEEKGMNAYSSKMQTRLKIVPQKIDYEVSEIRVLPKGWNMSSEPITIKVDPPIDGKALEALLASKDLEVEDGKLISFK